MTASHTSPFVEAGGMMTSKTTQVNDLAANVMNKGNLMTPPRKGSNDRLPLTS